MRAIRFEKRYNFSIEPDTLRLAKDAIERRMLGKLSYKRILQELVLIFNEQNPLPALKRMQEIGVWQYILPEVDLEKIDKSILRRITVVTAWFKERYHITSVRVWIVYMMTILSLLDDDRLKNIFERYNLDRQAVKAIKEARQAKSIIKQIEDNPEVRFSEIDKLINGWEKESQIYLLLLLKNEKIWEQIVSYLDRKEKIKLDINGNDLKELGIKPGPVYKEILDKLYVLKLDGIVRDKDDELNMAKKMIKEKCIL